MGLGPFVPLRAAVARLAAGFSSAPVAARLQRDGAELLLADSSGVASPLAPVAGAAEGDLVSGRLRRGADGFALDEARVLARRAGPPAPEDADLPRRLPLLRRRAAILAATRGFFGERDFLEVETPTRVVCPGMEPHLAPLPAGEGRWLITSPELHLKRLLAAGAPRIFELARSFRGDERGETHLVEFTMLEWYRAFEGLDALVADVSGLLRAAALAAGADPSRVPGCDLSLPPERLTVREAFRRLAGIDLAAMRELPALRAAAEAIGVRTAPDDDWDEIYFRIFLERVEPHLGRGRITVLEEYPASQAALSNVRPDPEWPVALRFEVYAGGMELANAFDELTDPAEQRRRHEADRAYRLAHGLPAPDLDEAFLAALEAGHPPAAGIALGVDRLVALALGERDIRRVVAFPE